MKMKCLFIRGVVKNLKIVIINNEVFQHGYNNDN